MNTLSKRRHIGTSDDDLYGDINFDLNISFVEYLYLSMYLVLILPFAIVGSLTIRPVAILMRKFGLKRKGSAAKIVHKKHIFFSKFFG